MNKLTSFYKNLSAKNLSYHVVCIPQRTDFHVTFCLAQLRCQSIRRNADHLPISSKKKINSNNVWI